MSAVKAEQLTEDFSLAKKPRLEIRLFVLTAVYLVLYFGLAWVTRALGSASAVSQWHLPAGLSFALLVLYGVAYAPAVLVALLIDNLWLHPMPGPMPLVTLHSLLEVVIQITAVAAVRRINQPCIDLKYGRDFMRFMAAGIFSSVALAAIAAADLGLRSSFEVQALSQEFVVNLIGFVTGFMAVTPLVVIHGGTHVETFLLRIIGEQNALSLFRQRPRLDRSATVFALSCLGSIATVLWLIVGQGLSQPLSVFLLFSLPLIWVALKRGLEGLSITIPLVIAASLVVFPYYRPGTNWSLWYQAILLVAALNAYLVGMAVTELAAGRQQMNRRNAILDAVGYAAKHFEGKGGWEDAVKHVIQRLGEATAVTRVFIMDKYTTEKGVRAGGSWQYEWTAPGLSMDEKDRGVLNLLRAQLIEDQANSLSLGQEYRFVTKDIARKQREMLEALGVCSVVIVPMFVDQQWWGCLGLEQCFVDREWPESEIESLKMAAEILGTLIGSVRVEQQFRQLTGNIQAVFWIASPDGYAKQYVSPGFEEVWGRSCSSLQREPRLWLNAIHSDDHARVCEALVKQVWGEYDEEYRVIRPDRSIRWVRDRAFPVRDKTGQVYRVVGIAEDVTGQKKTEEQLRAATVMLASLIDHLQSGVLVEDDARSVTHVNQAFINMFEVPIPPQSLFGVDSRLLYTQMPRFAERNEEIIREGSPILGEEVAWKDRIFRRNYVPLSMGEENRYHLWQYQDITDGKLAEEQIKSSLKEKEVLLKEIHHRVKNNLQIICSLLSLQANESREDPQAGQVLKESQNRIKAMALIHERFYQSRDMAKIDFAGYVRNLTGHLLKSYKVNSEAIRLHLEVESVPMNFDVAIPCGLMINELVSNALKYAFPNGSGGEIRVQFTDDNNESLKLTVCDTGVGFEEGSNPENSESLGLKLVRSLTDQLGGTVSYRNQNGFQCAISIPWSNKQ